MRKSNLQDIKFPSELVAELKRNGKLVATKYKDLVAWQAEKYFLAAAKHEFTTLLVSEIEEELPVCKIIDRNGRHKREIDTGIPQKPIGSQILWDVKIADEKAELNAKRDKNSTETTKFESTFGNHDVVRQEDGLNLKVGDAIPSTSTWWPSPTALPSACATTEGASRQTPTIGDQL